MSIRAARNRNCRAARDRLIVGDAHDQALAAFESDLGLWKYRDVQDALFFAWVDGRRLHSTDSVCSAIIRSSSVGTT